MSKAPAAARSRSVRRIERWREGKRTGPLTFMQVHDELLFEAPEAEVKKAGELIKREMEAAAELDVPLVADIGSGDNWMDAK